MVVLLAVLFLCVRPLVLEFLAVLVQVDTALNQLLGLQGDGLGEEVGVWRGISGGIP